MEIFDINTLFGAYPAVHNESTADSLVAALAKQGITRAMALSTSGVFYHDMTGNQETQSACQTHKQALLPVGTINPLSYWEDDFTLTALAQQFTMFRFFPGLQGWPIDFAPFSQILKVLSESGKPLLDRSITLPRPTRGWRLWTDSGVPLLVAIDKPGDATQLARVAKDYPAPVVMVGVTTETLIEALIVMRGAEQFLIETHRLTSPDGLARIRDGVGANRIVFGSGGTALSISAAVSYVQKSSLSDADKSAVFAGNAASLVLGGR